MISSSSNGWCAPTLSDADMYCTKEKLSISIIISWRKWFFSLEKKKKKMGKYYTRWASQHFDKYLLCILWNSFPGEKYTPQPFQRIIHLKKEREELLPEKTVKRYKEMNTPLNNSWAHPRTKYTTKKILAGYRNSCVCFFFFLFKTS